MGTGMADIIHRAALSSVPVALETIEEYDLYCHYVAGLLGEGLSRLFAATGMEAPSLAHQLELSNSVGLLLQKANIIRDFREDVEQRRFFWPHEIWGSPEYTADGCPPSADILELFHYTRRATWVQNAMILDALRHVCDVLEYVHLLQNRSIFNLVVIPAVMAFATLDLYFMNPLTFSRDLKICKVKAAQVVAPVSRPI